MEKIKYKAKSFFRTNEWVESITIHYRDDKTVLLHDGKSWRKIQPETLCISSGKFDINGVELYSNDKIDKFNTITFNILSGFSVNNDRPLHLFKDLVFNGNEFDSVIGIIKGRK